MVPAIVLPTPNVVFGQGKKLRQAKWNYAKVTILRPANSVSLIVFEKTNNNNAYQNVVPALELALKKFGVKVGKTKRESTLQKAVASAKKAPNGVVLALIDDKPASVYRHVKTTCDKASVISQCVSNHFGRPLLPGHAANIALKVNGKLGGLNYCPLLGPNETNDVLYVGVDVYHAPFGGEAKDDSESSSESVASGAGEREELSVAAVIGMYGKSLEHCEKALHLAAVRGQEVVYFFCLLFVIFLAIANLWKIDYE